MDFKPKLMAFDLDGTLAETMEPFDPEDPASLANFLNNNQTMDRDMSVALGLPSYDLSEVVWSDINDLSRWVFAHARSHMAASALLGVS